MRFPMIVSVALFLSGSALAQEGVQYSRVLLPISILEAFPVPGAFGSQWTTDLWVRNDAGVPVYMAPYYDGCHLPEGCGQYPVTAGVAWRPQSVTLDVSVPGVFFQIQRPFENQVDIELRVRDLSRQSESWGTELPTVPEESFTSEKVTLFDVPDSEGFRVMLRIYGIGDLDNSTVRVRTFSLDESALIPGSVPVLVSDQIVTLRSPAASLTRYVPHYAEMIPFQSVSSPGRKLIEITPATPGLRIWAFATVTNNETQQITIVTPQRSADIAANKMSDAEKSPRPVLSGSRSPSVRHDSVDQ
ncbi:MAG: hypothetical protein ABI718_13115 [Acidobacteriota bacterium]